MDSFDLPTQEYDNDIKFVIIMATFCRSNGNTPGYLQKSLSHILLQKYKNWDLIIVGDKYEPEEELTNIIETFKNKIKHNNKIIYINNQIVEREHIKGKTLLWYCAGATSMNKGLEYARNNGYKYYCHLDDDDYWTESHLESLYDVYKKFPRCVFANTKSTYMGSFLPQENMELYENNRLPIPCATIHSAFSFRIDIVPYYYSTLLSENAIPYPSDALMLTSIQGFIQNSGGKYTSAYNSKLTCYHDVEGEMK